MGKKSNEKSTINIRSSADLVKGQGVGSCYDEQTRLVYKYLSEYDIRVNSSKTSEIYHYHTINPDYFIERIFKKNKSSGIGYVHFIPETLEDSLDMPVLFKKVLYKYLISFYNSMDYLVTVNPTIIKKLKEYKINKPKIFYIPNFVSKDTFYIQDKLTIKNTREKFNLPKDKTIVMGVGQLQTRKGVLDFIDIARNMPKVYFIWAGGFCFGKMSNGFLEIQNSLKDLPPNISFLGMVERSDMGSLYNASDIFFLPSYDELFPMAILEAMSCGKPVVIRNIDDYKDILPDYCLFGNDNSEFIKLISNLDLDLDFRKRFQEKSIEGSNFYSEKSVANSWINLYNLANENALQKIELKERKSLKRVIERMKAKIL